MTIRFDAISSIEFISISLSQDTFNSNLFTSWEIHKNFEAKFYHSSFDDSKIYGLKLFVCVKLEINRRKHDVYA